MTFHMCVLIAVFKPLPECLSFFIHIRDEDPARPTSDFQVINSRLLCAIDQSAGGAAVAFNPESLRVAFLNNLHEPSYPDPGISRGGVVLAAVAGAPISLSRVNPFQLLTGDLSTGEFELVVHSGSETCRVSDFGDFLILDNQRGGGARAQLVRDRILPIKSIDQLVTAVSAVEVLLPPSPERKTCSLSQTVVVKKLTAAVEVRHRTIRWEAGLPVFSDWKIF